MQDSAKYLIHADIRASGVVERSDVVGAIFGQTEGLLGDDLDLRDLQESSKVGRIDVEINSEGGRSYGTVTVASGLDRVETAVLAAALETIDRIGPCRAEFEVRNLEDVRAAKRRKVVDRATDLLAEFEETALSSRELVEEVRQNVRVEDITAFEGVPAGPRVAESDAIVVVEGRADVLQLLKYGIKNAVAVEGTDVPDAVADLTRERTVTAFLDGDRGGDLILEELAQVGSVDHVAFASAGRSVENLSREEVLSALREKTPHEEVADVDSPHDTETNAGRVEAGQPDRGDVAAEESADESQVDADGGTVARQPGTLAEPGPDTGDDPEPPSSEATDAEQAAEEPGHPQTLAGHAGTVSGTGTVRLLDESFDAVAEADAGDAFDAIEGAAESPHAVVLDAELSQRVLDVAAQRGVRQIVARDEGEFVKRPVSVRVRTTDGF